VAVQLTYTIVSVRDKHDAARFFVEIIGLPEPGSYGPFRVDPLSLAGRGLTATVSVG
jgi:hypothetical protein